ncbi:GroES-like protein [Armillaria solidipes]|uniref:GroES-like protein n=1 Tax=Armillaria solidipes TaxID=1076256 RepID=A0A2H3BV84_9AGAR|nr:GroES-like protein [Armillaria solidipes]
MAQPISNKACVPVGPEMIEFKDVPVPSVGRHDVLVRVEASDRETLTKPVVMGHEAAGIVVQVGEVVVDVAVGDRVAIEPIFFCKRSGLIRILTRDGRAIGKPTWILQTLTEKLCLTFGGKAFPINPDTFNLGQAEQGSSDCVGGIVAGDFGAFNVKDETVGFANLA